MLKWDIVTIALYTITICISQGKFLVSRSDEKVARVKLCRPTRGPLLVRRGRAAWFLDILDKESQL